MIDKLVFAMWPHISSFAHKIEVPLMLLLSGLLAATSFLSDTTIYISIFSSLIVFIVALVVYIWKGQTARISETVEKLDSLTTRVVDLEAQSKALELLKLAEEKAHDLTDRADRIAEELIDKARKIAEELINNAKK